MGRHTIRLKLKVAKSKDLLELDGYKKGGAKVWKLRNGFPFWLINSKGKIENKNYILNEDTDPADIGNWLARQQILIPK